MRKLVSVFKNIEIAYSPMHVDVEEIFQRIKNCNEKKIIDLVRAERDKEKRKEIKAKLNSICFSGTFSYRDDKNIIEHSGLIVLDIDEDPNFLETKKKIAKDPYTYSVFISPSYNGLKVIVKIPDIISEHRSIFKALQKYYKETFNIELDPTGINISRVCYESCDPDIYINKDSETWAEVFIEEKELPKIERPAELPPNELFTKLVKWVEVKKGMKFVVGSRNIYIFKLSAACCRFGISKSDTESFLVNFDLPDIEKRKTIKSAYDRNVFASARFEPSNNNYTPNVKTSKSETVGDFWEIDKKGKVKIDTEKLEKFVNALGFGIYRPPSDDRSKFEFIRVKNMIVESCGVIDMKQAVLKYLSKKGEKAVYDELQMNGRYFSKSFLDALQIIDVKKARDTKNTCNIFFEGFYYEITETTVTKKSYIDLKEKHLWKNQIAKAKITKYIKEPKTDFDTFIRRALGNNEGKILSLRTTLGYLLHTFKRSSKAIAPYFTELSIGSTINEPNGGSGKSLAQSSVGWLRSMVVLDGKDYDPKSQFKFQLVEYYHDVVLLEDVDIDVKDLFVKITNDFQVRKLHKPTIVIPFLDAAKIGVNSNSQIRSSADSVTRRFVTLTFTDHYNANHFPLDEFEKEFFSEWNQTEWNNFVSWQFQNVQLYMKHGVIRAEEDSKYKKLVLKVGFQFAEYFIKRGDDDLSEWFNGQELCEQYRLDNKSKKEIDYKDFFTGLKDIAKTYGWKYEDKGKGKSRKCRIVGFDIGLQKEKVHKLNPPKKDIEVVDELPF